MRRPAPLREMRSVRQVPGEPRRRWFTSPELDLIVWCDEAGRPVEFQLCYDTSRAERALTWRRETGFEHRKVDAGEDVGLGVKRTPILLADGRFDAPRVHDQFVAAARALPPDVADFVAAKLREYPPT